MASKITDLVEQFIEKTPFALFGCLEDKHAIRRQIADSQGEFKNVDSLHLVSIIMPLFNSNELQLEDAILSVISQSYPRWEIVAVDDGSSKDGHIAIVEKFKRYFPSQIILHREIENNGISAARNRAIELSSGTYVGILDHDDILHPLAIAESIKQMRISKANFTFSFEVKLTDDGKDLREFLSKPKFSWFTLLHLNYVCHFTIIERSFLDTVKIEKNVWFNSEFDGAEDHDLFLRCSRAEGFNPAVVPLFLYLWRMTPLSTSSDQTHKPLSRNRGVLAAIDCLGSDKYAGEDGSTTHPFRTHSYLRPKALLEISEIAVIATDSLRIKLSPFEKPNQSGVRLKNLEVGSCPRVFDAKTLNLHASYHDSEFLLFVNPNIRFTNPHVLEEAIGWLKHFPEIGSIGLSIVDVPRVPDLHSPNLDAASYPIHSSYCIREAPGVGGGYRFSSFVEKRWFAFEGRQVIANSRHFLLVRRRDFWDYKGFDELRFRHNGFDLDLGIRIHNEGKINVNLGFVGVEGYGLEECKFGFGDPDQIHLYDKLPQGLGALQLCNNYAYNLNGLRH